MKRNEKGFTLIEAVITLIILSLSVSLSFRFIIPLYDYMQLNSALSVFSADLHLARDSNMMQQTEEGRLIIRIYHEENRYTLTQNQTLLLERQLPTGVQILHANPISTISFNERGNLGQGRTLTFLSQHHERRVVFSVGAGGFDVR